MTDDLRCSLCSQAQADVDRLVQGEGGGAVCSSCVAEAVVVLDGGGGFGLMLSALGRMLSALDEHAPFAHSGPLLRAALALAQDDAAMLRNIGGMAFRLSQFEIGIDAWSLIPDDAATADDRFQQLFGLHRAPRYEDGSRLLEQIEPARLCERHLALYRIHKVGFRLAARAAVDGAEMRALMKGLEEVEAIHRSADAEAWAEIQAPLALARARCALGAGRPAEAVRLLEAAARAHNGSLGSSYLRLLGDAKSAASDPAGARSAWSAALAVAHPESADAAEARARLAEIERDDSPGER
jgi:hypothetical protein